MSHLLTPTDEIKLVRYLCDDLGLALLLSDLTERGEPRIASDPVAALPRELPGRAKPSVEASTATVLTFWCVQLGPVRTMASAGPPTQATDHVGRLLAKESAKERYEELIDFSRTPIVRWKRCVTDAPERILPGSLQAMNCKVKETPEPVLGLHRRVEGWLRSSGERLNPFEHCDEVRDRAPQNLVPFWVWAQPDALRWVRDGWEVWPWTG